MARDLPYFKMYPKDFDTDENVRALSFSEAGLFLFCLNHAWINGGLPNDPEEIARLLKVESGEFTKLWARVGRCFHQDGSGRLVNGRQEEERAKAFAKSRKCAEATAAREGKRRASIIGRSSDDHLRAYGSDCGSSFGVSSQEEKPLRARETAPLSLAPRPPQQLGDWPMMAAAVHQNFPDATIPDVQHIADQAQQAFLQVDAPKCEFSDAILAEAVKRCTKPNQFSVRLYFQTVPTCIKTWATEGIQARAGPDAISPKMARTMAILKRNLQVEGKI